MPRVETLGDVQADLVSLGLFNPDSDISGTNDVYVSEVVMATSRIGQAPLPKFPNIRTSFGRRIIDAARRGIVFDNHEDGAHYGVCEMAEDRLATCLEYDREVPFDLPSVLILDGETPIALIKGFGEKTTYALRTAPDVGLIERTFGLPGRRLHPGVLKKSSGVYAVQAKEFGGFNPIRFSYTALPSAVLEALRKEDPYGISYRVSHRRARQMARQMLPHAVRLSGGELQEAFERSAGYYAQKEKQKST